MATQVVINYWASVGKPSSALKSVSVVKGCLLNGHSSQMFCAEKLVGSFLTFHWVCFLSGGLDSGGQRHHLGVFKGRDTGDYVRSAGETICLCLHLLVIGLAVGCQGQDKVP